MVYHAQLSRSELDCLARAGALNKLAGHRYQARWEAQGVEPPRPLLNDHSSCHHKTATDSVPVKAAQIQLPTPNEAQEVYEDYAYLGLSLRRHPLALLRNQHKTLQRCKTAAQLPAIGHKGFVQVAGLVTGRQRPMTASGVIFLTLEDETGNVNVIIWKSVAERQRTPLMSARLLKIKGTVEKEGSVIHVIAGHLQSCDHLLGSLAVHSRDFH